MKKHMLEINVARMSGTFAIENFKTWVPSLAEGKISFHQNGCLGKINLIYRKSRNTGAFCIALHIGNLTAKENHPSCGGEGTMLFSGYVWNAYPGFVLIKYHHELLLKGPHLPIHKKHVNLAESKHMPAPPGPKT